MKSLIGPNTPIRYLKDYQSHVRYWHDVNPVYSLAYIDKREHAPYIQEYAAEFPETMIVARLYHPIDGGFHLPPEDKTIGKYIASPQNYHNDLGWLGQISNIILNVFNEPDGKADASTIQRLVDWFLEYIPIAVQGKTKSVLFNWGKGQPLSFGDMMDARFGVVLKAASLHPELFWMGFHCYGPQDTTESIRAYIALCESLTITPLRVIITEWGNDVGAGGESEAKWEISQIQHDLSEFIKSGVVVGFNRFQDGNSGGWDHYAIENDMPYKNEIKRAAQAGELAMIPDKKITQTTPAVAKKDVVFGRPYRIRKDGDVIKAYLLPYDNDPGIPPLTIPSNAVVTVLDKTTTNNKTWYKITYKNFTGERYIQADLIDDITATVEVSTVKVDDPPVSPTPPAEAPTIANNATSDPPKGYYPTPAQIKILEAWRDELTAKLAIVNGLLAITEAKELST